VSLETPLVDTTTASVAGLVGEREVKDLPLNGRSFDNLITLNPGAINYTYKSPGTVTSQGNTFSVACRRPVEDLFRMNGIEDTGIGWESAAPPWFRTRKRARADCRIPQQERMRRCPT